MSDLKIFPSKLKGAIQIPPSKSQSMRALLFALLAKGKSVIQNLLPSPDVDAMLHACTLLGASIVRQEECVEIVGLNGKISGAEDVIQAGNSGLVYRFLSAVAALSTKPIVITGDASIRHRRPISPLLDALNQLGAEAISTRGDGGAPIIVKGPLYPGSATLDGEDSQPVSALLIASAFACGPIEIYVMRPGEKPWIDLTLHWFSKLGIPFVASQHEYYKLQGNASLNAFHYTVPADLSSLSYPLAAAILTDSEILIKNFDLKDPQGDKKVITYLQRMGALLELDEVRGELRVKRGGVLKGIKLDINECIDALPLLSVVGCFAEGKTEISGAAIARKKESDRISCMCQELKKMGAAIEEHSDGLTIFPSSLKGAEVHSYQDHRLALSLAIAGLAATGETVVKNSACIDKSFPSFCAHMQKIGALIHTA